MDKPETPNLNKMLEVHEESNLIGRFVDWLQGERCLFICTEDEHFDDPEEETQFCPTCGAEASEWCEGTIFAMRRAVRGDSGIRRLLAEYYRIDYDEMDRERERLIEYCQWKQSEEARNAAA